MSDNRDNGTYLDRNKEFGTYWLTQVENGQVVDRSGPYSQMDLELALTPFQYETLLRDGVIPYGNAN